MQRHLLYIINPVSGSRSNKDPLQELIKKKTGAAGLPFTIYPSAVNGCYDHLHPVIKEKGITDVIIAGGDGTVNQVVNSLRGLDVQFGILPCGSGNGLALSAGIPRSKTKALDLIFEGKSNRTDGFLINNYFACMLCGLGFDAQVAHDFANDPRRGLVTYVRKTVRHFFTSAAYPFSVTAEGKTLHIEAFFISIANSNQFGNNVTIAPKASLSDGLLDIVIMTRQNKLKLLLQTVKQISGRNSPQEMALLKEKHSVLYFQTPELTIENKGSAPLHIDGDPAPAPDKLCIKILPQCFRLMS